MLEFQTPEAPPEVTVVQQQLPQLLPDRIGFIGGGQVSACCSYMDTHDALPPSWRAQAALPLDRLGAYQVLLSVQMGEALMKAFLSAGVCTPSGMIASLRNSDRRAGLASLGVQTVGDAIFDNGAAEVAASSDIIFLAVCFVHVFASPLFVDLQSARRDFTTSASTPCWPFSKLGSWLAFCLLTHVLVLRCDLRIWMQYCKCWRPMCSPDISSSPLRRACAWQALKPDCRKQREWYVAQTSIVPLL